MRNGEDFKEKAACRKEDAIEVSCKMETVVGDEWSEKSRPLRQAGTD